MFDNVYDCCDFTVATLDGVYGWASEMIAIVTIVFVFTFIAKIVLQRLQLRFEQQGKIWKDSFVKALYLPLSYLVWFFAIIQSLALIAARIYKEFPSEDRHLVIGVGALLAFTWFLLRWKNFIVQHMLTLRISKKIALDRGKIAALNKLATVAIIFFSILMLMEISHRSVTTIIAFGGIGGLALAFASQEIIANFFGGFMIYLTQPFTIGDWILIPDRNIEGHVEEIGWYLTRIRSFDKRPIYIPNAIFSKLIVITPSRMTHRQIKETIGVRCEDMPKIKKIIQDIRTMLQQHPDLDNHQPIIANFASFGQFSLDLYIDVYTQTINKAGYLQIKEDVLLKIAEVLEKNGAEIALPLQHIAFSEGISLRQENKAPPPGLVRT